MRMRHILKAIIPQGTRDWLRGEIDADKHKETHINRALRRRPKATYVEIGVRDGSCFSVIEAPRKIAVDPAPQGPDKWLRSGERLFGETSDEFFEKHAADVFSPGCVDVALVDGLHEFTQALRDVLNLERYMSPDGVIFIHDCNPPTRKHVEENNGGAWTGDVWKVACYLVRRRADLSFFTLDCDWGVGVLRNFAPTKAGHFPTTEEISAYKSLDYDVLEVNRKKELRLRPAWVSRIVRL
ncbi:MAG: class I SAM-dependent methyltransferase [bacterium]